MQRGSELEDPTTSTTPVTSTTRTRTRTTLIVRNLDKDKQLLICGSDFRYLEFDTFM